MDLSGMLHQFAALQGRPTYTDTPGNPIGYSNQWEEIQNKMQPAAPWEVEGVEEEQAYKRRLHQLYQLMQQHPQHRQSLQDLFMKALQNELDQRMHQNSFGKHVRENDRRLQEMRYLPTGEWDRTIPRAMVPLPRRM